MKSSTVKKSIAKLADPKRAEKSKYFFKTGPGQYGEGDIFIGLTVPQMRGIAKEYGELPLPEVSKLLKSKIHEERLVALLMLVQKFEKGGEKEQKDVYTFYLKHTKHINNWDLVDLSCHKIVGSYLLDKDRQPLYKLARSKNMWEQRIAIVSTWMIMRSNDLDDTFGLAEILIDHEHDLMHKAVGWMLREAGKRDEARLVKFLEKHYDQLPRTLLRYAIEKFPEKRRKAALQGKF